MMITYKSFLIFISHQLKLYGVPISGLCLLVITILSFIPVSQQAPISNIDKIEHLVAYAAFTMPISLAYHPRYKAIFWFACLWGMMIEILQPYAGRQADTIDAIINAVGAGAGVIIAQYIVMVLCTDPLPSDE